MAKKPTRTSRWYEAASDARNAFDELTTSAQNLADALNALREVQSEYEEWRDNLPENAQNGATAEKLEAVCDIDIESIMDSPLENWSDVETAIDEAEGAELPLGFGRD